jgi:hypothetical protein
MPLPIHGPFFRSISGVVLLAGFVVSIFSSPSTLLAAMNLQTLGVSLQFKCNSHLSKAGLRK